MKCKFCQFEKEHSPMCPQYLVKKMKELLRLVKKDPELEYRVKELMVILKIK